MKNSTGLVIMAAGLATRYGGLKQVESVGPCGEILMEYAIYDALRAGFNKVVFIIRPDMQETFADIVGNRVAKAAEVHYALQDNSSLPKFYDMPKARIKPLGTVHAMLSAGDLIDCPFALINADDYYGRDAIEKMYSLLNNCSDTEHASLITYKLKNTISEYGHVTRGICRIESDKLVKISETYKIMKFPDNTIRDTATSEQGEKLDPESPVSMNFWGFGIGIFKKAQACFERFLMQLAEGDLTSEYPLPVMVQELIQQGEINVTALPSASVWFGMTNKEDRLIVKNELSKMTAQGIYPNCLFPS